MLPSSWATVGAFPNLTVLNLANNTLSGTLVSEWGNDQGALPALRQLDLHANHLTGLLPRAWGSGLPVHASPPSRPALITSRSAPAQLLSQPSAGQRC